MFLQCLYQSKKQLAEFPLCKLVYDRKALQNLSKHASGLLFYFSILTGMYFNRVI